MVPLDLHQSCGTLCRPTGRTHVLHHTTCHNRFPSGFQIQTQPTVRSVHDPALQVHLQSAIGLLLDAEGSKTEGATPAEEAPGVQQAVRGLLKMSPSLGPMKNSLDSLAGLASLNKLSGLQDANVAPSKSNRKHFREDDHVGASMLDLPENFKEICNQDGRVGIYRPKERAKLIARFLEKRRRRVWHKKIRYGCRKNLADNRLRIKGRFVKRENLTPAQIKEYGL